jgi:hypothetical protein
MVIQATRSYKKGHKYSTELYDAFYDECESELRTKSSTTDKSTIAKQGTA